MLSRSHGASSRSSSETSSTRVENDRVTDVQNRASWLVTSIEDVRLEVANVADSTEWRWIVREYAAEHAHRAYASTVHGIQGETVDASIVGPGWMPLVCRSV